MKRKNINIKWENEYYFFESLRQKIISEVNSYLNQKRYKSENFDLLGWWRDNENHYPYVAKTAKHYLCIPATSVTSENNTYVTEEAKNELIKITTNLHVNTHDQS